MVDRVSSAYLLHYDLPIYSQVHRINRLCPLYLLATVVLYHGTLVLRFISKLRRS